MNGHNWVAMCQNYFSKGNGQNLYLNNTPGETGGSFWYELFPSILFYRIYDSYPSIGDMDEHFRIVADRWYQACEGMGGRVQPWTIPDFNHTAFNFDTMKPFDNGIWKEAGCSAAIGWIEYMAYTKTGEKKYLDAAKWGMEYLDNTKQNPFYEILFPHGVYTAARMNAEMGTDYDIDKLINWCFDGSNWRKWGISVGKWGGIDCAGLSCSVYEDDDQHGYAFAMNTYNMAGSLVPTVRYDDRYARAIGKWMLNAANSIRLFYANGLPESQQTGFEWASKYDPTSCIAYEGLKSSNESLSRPKADYKTPFGKVKSGTFKNALYTNKDYQVLEESITGGNDRLEHIWLIDVPPAIEYTINIAAKSTGDENFKMSYATSPDGPFEPIAVVKPGENSAHSVIVSFKGSQLYLKAEDENTKPGSDSPGTLSVDDVWVIAKRGIGPLAGGDAKDHRWAAEDFGLYGSSFVGIYGAIIEKTNVKGILQLDCLATDYYRGPAWPTYLYYNPYPEAKTVEIDLGSEKKSLYDAVSNKFVRNNVSGQTTFEIKPDSAVMVVVVPAGGNVVYKNGKTYVNDVVIDYNVEDIMGNIDDTALPDWAIGPFTKYEGNPVLAPSKSGWDEGRHGGGVHNGSIIIKDDVFYYIYRGGRKIDTSPGYLCKVGLATSTDGYNFKKYHVNPLFGADDKYSYEDVEIVSYKGTYYLYVNRWDWDNVADTTQSGIWMATSKDLKNWKEHGIVFAGSDRMHRNGTVLQNPQNVAVKVNGKFIMYANSGIVAYSSDLIHWESKKAVRDWPGGECCKAITDYSNSSSDNIVLITGGGHCGNGFDNNTEWGQDHFYAIGEILLSKKNPEKPIETLKRPVLFAEKKYPWESGKSVEDPTKQISQYTDCIFLNAVTRYKGKWWVYYGGSEVYTCLATAPVLNK
jgi:predicted GH43/DUF377 family glycosyl hydrolase